MNLGMITKSMCNTVLKIAKNMTSTFLHHSYGREFDQMNQDSSSSVGGKENVELPHLMMPMWEAIDNLIITKPGEQRPKMGSIIKEDAEVKARRQLGNPAQPPEVDLSWTYTFTFKTSNLDIRYVCVCLCVCVYVCMYVRARMHVCMNVCMYVSILM